MTRAHMEEDTGKLTHVGAGGRINSAHHALVDYNRSGVPLVEIVSEPDMRSSAQARAYAAELRGILVATGASDGRMEEGSMRVDANVSVGPAGTSAFGTRCEIKNLNSLRSLGRAIEYEAARQIALLESGERSSQETRHWDEAAGRTEAMRSKEEANDYRYFPEPDLVPLAPDAAWQDTGARRPGPDAGRPPGRAGRRRWAATASEAEADQIRAVVDLGLDALVTAAVGRRARRPRWPWPGRPTRWRPRARPGWPCPAESFAALLAMEAGGALSATQSKAVLARAARAGGGDPAARGQGDGIRGHGRRRAGRRGRRGRRGASRRVGALPRGRRQADAASSPAR